MPRVDRDLLLRQKEREENRKKEQREKEELESKNRREMNEKCFNVGESIHWFIYEIGLKEYFHVFEIMTAAVIMIIIII